MTAKHPYPAHVVEAVAKALWETAPASQVIGWDDLAPQDSQHSDYTSKANTALNALWESDNHAHTPSSDHLGKLIWETIHNDVYETDLSFAGANNLVDKIMSSEWLAEVIAAAEQRGAARVEQAVLDLHKPFQRRLWIGNPWQCSECVEEDGTGTTEPLPYPCPTVRAITDSKEGGNA